MSQGPFGHGVGAFTGQELPCGVQVSVLYLCVDGTGERGDVGDGDDPLVGVEACGFAGEAELERAVGKRLKAQVALGVPLHPGQSPLQLALPCGVIGVESVLVVGQAGVFQRPLETFPGDLDREDGLLPFLGAPPAAVHHPQERRLDPGHPVPLPHRRETALPGRRQADPRGVRLVDGDRGVRVQGSDLVLGFCHKDQGGHTGARAPSNYRDARLPVSAAPSPSVSSIAATQIAPTIVRLLGLDARALDAVRTGHTPALPAR